MEIKLEYFAATLMSMAGVATSWSGYQASIWGGQQSDAYTQSMSLRMAAAQAKAEAGQLQLIDANLFMQWLNARAGNNLPLAEFYQRRFRPEFLPAFETWLARQPLHNPKAPPTPFSETNYHLASQARGARLEVQSKEIYQSGLDANAISDRYVLNTVIFAIVILFAGGTQSFERRRVKIALLTVALLMATLGFGILLRQPIAY